MPTLRQRKVAQKIVDSLSVDKPPSAGAVLKSVGYGTGLQTQPKRVLQSNGVREALEDLGFSIEGADSVVQKILHKSKREDMKLKAADMVYKRLGAYEDTKQSAGKTLIINVTQETAERYALTPNTETSSEG